VLSKGIASLHKFQTSERSGNGGADRRSCSTIGSGVLAEWSVLNLWSLALLCGARVMTSTVLRTIRATSAATIESMASRLRRVLSWVCFGCLGLSLSLGRAGRRGGCLYGFALARVVPSRGGGDLLLSWSARCPLPQQDASTANAELRRWSGGGGARGGRGTRATGQCAGSARGKWAGAAGVRRGNQRGVRRSTR